MQTHRYGEGAAQEGDLDLPPGPRPPVVCLLHGGFWRMPYGRDQLAPLAEALVRRGFATWNLGYRRLGAPGGGWPGTLQDVAAGIDHLAALAERTPLDLARVFVVGHSAGGHLALWAAARTRSDASVFAAPRVRPRAAAGLAPIADLAAAFRLGCGGSAVAALLGGSPTSHPERYRAASPLELLPLGLPQLVVHGLDDDAVPAVHSRAYARAARAAGDPIELVELRGAGHMDLVDPAGPAVEPLCEWLRAR
jgi:acetyl esterase/lipase